MNIKIKNKTTLLHIIVSSLALLVFRFIYAVQLEKKMVWGNTLSTFIITVLTLLLAFCASYLMNKDNIKTFARILSVLTLIAVIFFVLYKDDLYELGDTLASLRIIIPISGVITITSMRPFIPLMGIFPLGYIMFRLKDKSQDVRTLVSAGFLLAFCLATSFIPGALPSILAFLISAVLLFSAEMIKGRKMNLTMIIAPVLCMVVATLISYKVSGCSCIERFIIYQYEPSICYLEGPWDSLAIFDGSLCDAIKSVGLVSGTASDIVPVFTGNYYSPINVLLTFGWIPYIMMKIAEIALVVSAVKLCLKLNLEKLQWCAIILTCLLCVITLGANLLMPCYTTPMGPVSTRMLDGGIIIVVFLLRLYSLENIKIVRPKPVEPEEEPYDDTLIDEEDE